MLGPFGVTESEEQLYRVLLTLAEPSLAELAAATGCGASGVTRRLRALEAKGLVTRTPARPVRYRPTAPDLAFEILALDRHKEIDRARLAAGELTVLWEAAARARAVPLQVVVGQDSNTQRYLQTQLAATREVLTLDRPPYLEEGVEPQYRVQLDLMARGVHYRTVYDRLSLEEPGQYERLRVLAEHGERARVVDGVPLKMLITDRSSGLVPFVLAGQRQSVVLDRSPLLDGLVALFEALWERGTPLWSTRAAGGLDASDEQMLGFAAAGYTDESIARRTGLSKRTVERRMRHLMDVLGARTRFQAGIQAGRRGFLE
ncbi:helix-turn-helix domain-containing protein [Kitasatospora sp. NPDC001574]